MKNFDHLDTLEQYQQDSGAGITYQFLVKPGDMGLLSAGRVRLVGPTHKQDDTHAEWDQVYLVLSGEGTVLVGDQRCKVTAGSVVRVPRNTLHGVILQAGQRLEYCYFNAFTGEDAVRRVRQSL